VIIARYTDHKGDNKVYIVEDTEIENIEKEIENHNSESIEEEK